MKQKDLWRWVMMGAIALAGGCATRSASTSSALGTQGSDVHGDDSDVRPDAGTRAWAGLLAGNARYAAGAAERPNQTVQRRGDVAYGQHPVAVVLSCSDSRVTPEIIFDQGLGDLFVIRVAGNTADDAAVGSMEYGVEHLGVPLIVVLGHDRCGAVEAAVAAADSHEAPAGHLAAVVDPIEPAVKAVEPEGGDVVDHAVTENVLRVVEQLKSCEPVLAERVREHKLTIVGARYNLDTGQVSELQR